MPEIHQRSLEDVVATLPPLVQINGADLPIDRIDLLITAAGFENRSTAICTSTENIEICDQIIVRYPTNQVDNENARRSLREIRRSGSVHEIMYDRAEFRSKLLKCLRAYSSRKNFRLLIDLSGLSSYAFFRLMPLLFDCLPFAHLGLFYAEACEYFPAEKEWCEFLGTVDRERGIAEVARRYAERSEGFQSRGVEIVYESEAFSGRNPDALPVQLVTVPNFSLERMKTMLSFCERQFNALSRDAEWLIGCPPNLSRNGWRTKALRQLYVDSDNHLHVLSTLEYIETIQQLEDLFERKCADRHMVLVTLGSKMQHLGVLLFLLMHRDVGLVLSEPKEFFAGRFSSGVGQKWWLDFGKVGDVRSMLDSLGMLTFTW